MATACIGVGLAAVESASASAVAGPPLPGVSATSASTSHAVEPIGRSATTANSFSATAATTATAAAAAGTTGQLTITIWLVRCPSGRFDPGRGEPDHLDRGDFDRLITDGVLVIDDQVTATGPAGVRIHGERRQDLPKNTVFAATTDHVGLDLDAVVDAADGEQPGVDLNLVRLALVKLGGAESALPSLQKSTWTQHCDLTPGALRFVGQGIRPGSTQPGTPAAAQAVLIAMGAP